MIRLENVSYSYPDGTHALRNINLAIKKGEYLGIMGRNGSGKSTLVLHLNGLLKPQKGRVTVKGMDTGDYSKLREIRKTVGIVFQNPETQFIGRTVEEDLAFGPENLCLPSAEIRTRVDRALSEIKLEKYRYHSPKTLSGGQGQCVALEGVLTMEPECLVFDEVTSMLDPVSGETVLKRVERLHKRGKTIVYTTHNLEELHSADRIIVMDRGRIVLEGEPEYVLSDPSLRDIGLTPPSLIELAEQLKTHGIEIPWEKTSSPSSFAEEICRLFSKT
jgi:energy-coupling factor transport system ATP-binding protein